MEKIPPVNNRIPVSDAARNPDGLDRWASVEAILEAAKVQSRQSESKLSRLLKESDRHLKPLCDPLRANIGLNRWLAADREEAYSDWLKWILEELDSGDDVLKLLHIWSPELSRACRGVSYEVEREYQIPRGRLDIVVRFKQEALIVIEVKKTPAEIAEIEKHTGYCDWIGKETAQTKYPLLLTVGSANEEHCKGFTSLSWEDLCIGLRGILLDIQNRRGVVAAAMFVAFISAVETNLLHLVPPGKGRHGRSLLYARTAAHIERSLISLKGETS